MTMFFAGDIDENLIPKACVCISVLVLWSWYVSSFVGMKMWEKIHASCFIYPWNYFHRLASGPWSNTASGSTFNISPPSAPCTRVSERPTFPTSLYKSNFRQGEKVPEEIVCVSVVYLVPKPDLPDAACSKGVRSSLNWKVAILYYKCCDSAWQFPSQVTQKLRNVVIY